MAGSKHVAETVGKMRVVASLHEKIRADMAAVKGCMQTFHLERDEMHKLIGLRDQRTADLNQRCQNVSRLRIQVDSELIQAIDEVKELRSELASATQSKQCMVCPCFS